MNTEAARHHTPWAGRALSLLRIVAAFLFIAHGTQKLLGFPVPPPGPIDMASRLGVAGVIEITGGALLLVGFVSRVVAFVLTGEMAVAYFTTHLPNGFWPLANGGELAVLYCFIFLFIVAAGPGPWSLDARIHHAHARRHGPEDGHEHRWVTSHSS